jgi:hypothetical protein
MLFKNSVRTSKRTPHFTITKINWLTLFKAEPVMRFRTEARHMVALRLATELVTERAGLMHFSSIHS